MTLFLLALAALFIAAFVISALVTAARYDRQCDRDWQAFRSRDALHSRGDRP